MEHPENPLNRVRRYYRKAIHVGAILKLKFMKKLIPFVLFILFIAHQKAICQKARLGIGAGVTLANMYSNADGEKDNGDSKIGLTIGVFTDIPLSSHMSFQPALNFLQKGTKDNDDGIKAKVNLNYLELPLNFLYNSNSTAGNFFIGGGPSFAYGISGKTTITFQGEKESAKVNFGSDPSDDLRRLDMGVNFMTGYCLKSGFRVALNYNHGLSNLNPGGNDEGKLRSSYFGLGIAFLPGHKK
jgi:hypothetical protein